MAILSPYHNFAFLHIPKTAGSSVRRLLTSQQNCISVPAWHIDMDDLVKHQNYVNGMTTFTIVRNPFDRLYSMYQFICHKKLNGEEVIRQDYYKEIGFKQWLMCEEFYIPNNIPVSPDMIPIQQKQQLDYMGSIEFDIVCRFETVCDDFACLTEKLFGKKINLPKINASDRDVSYIPAYDAAMIAFMREYHSDDLKYFNYKFGVDERGNG